MPSVLKCNFQLFLQFLPAAGPTSVVKGAEQQNRGFEVQSVPRRRQGIPFALVRQNYNIAFFLGSDLTVYLRD